MTDQSAEEKATVLHEALPYIRRFWGKVVVVKYGGNAIARSGTRMPATKEDVTAAGEGFGPSRDDKAVAQFADDVVLMRSVGMLPVVVHGGGPQIGDLMRRLGKEPEFVGGLRVTDAETLEIARMVLVGKVNRDLVNAVNVHGPLAVGLSGEDGGLITAAARSPELGFVGDVVAVNAELLHRLLNQELIPIVATIGSDLGEGQPYNINADTAAGAIAEALHAEKLVYLTNIEGLRRDVDDPSSLVSTVTADELQQMIDDGTLEGGMLPKVRACLHAVRNGVTRAHILDGRAPHALLLEVFTDRGIGTMVTA